MKRRRRVRARPSEEQLARKWTEPCFFADRGPCDGPLDLAHAIPRQRLRQRGLPEWDGRVLVVCCRTHHHRWDHSFISLDRDQLPPGVEEFAREHGVEGSLDRDYGMAA